MSRLRLGLCLAAVGLAACDPVETSGVTVSPEARDSLPETVPVLYREADCVEPSATAETGQVYEYRLLDPDGEPDMTSSVRRSIRAVSGDQIDYSEQLTMEGVGTLPAEPRRVRLSVLPTRFMTNSVRYENAAAAMGELRPGQSVDIRMWETTETSPEPLQGEATLTFVGCGLSNPVVVGAPDEPVRVYRVQLPYSRIDTPGEFSSMMDNTFLVSATRGWPIAERQGGGTLVLADATG